MTVQAPPVFERARELVEPTLRAALQTLTPEMRAPAEYHFGWTDRNGTPVPDGGGKGVRPALALLSAEVVGADASVAIPGAAAVQLVHNFSLLHDDIIDVDTERRHRETVWSAWSIGDAVIVGDAMHALALELLLRDASAPSVAAARRLAAGTTAMILGQSADMSFDTRDNVTLADCLDMEAKKTGALLAFSSSVGAVLAEADESAIDRLDRFGQALGIAFQAIDDILGIWGDPTVTGKAVGNDLRERKKSMPVVAALESGHELAPRIAALYAEATLADAQLVELASLIDSAGGRERTEEVAAEHMQVALAALDYEGFVPKAVDELTAVAHFVANRSF